MMDIIKMKPKDNLLGFVGPIIVTMILFGSFHDLYAQHELDRPTVGYIMPRFVFKDVHGFTKSTIENIDIVGQSTILDFWSTGCGACIEAFPKMNGVQEKYRNRLRIILVGLEEKQRDVRRFYEIYRKRFSLNLISAYDSMYFKRFVSSGVPHLIWIDRDGRVKAITRSDYLTDDNIEKFISGRNFIYEDISHDGINEGRQEVDISSPLLLHGNGGADSSYAMRSILSIWKPNGMGREYLRSIENYIKQFKAARFQTTKANVSQLFSLAYFGALYDESRRQQNVYYKPLFSPRIKSFQTTYYNYSIDLPNQPPNKSKIMQIMQSDLENYFGFEAKVIEKQLNCLVLVKRNYAKFSLVIDRSSDITTNSWFAESPINYFVNTPIDEFLKIIVSKLPIEIDRDLVFNETGFVGNLSIEIVGPIDDLGNVRKELRKIGLDLVWRKRVMKVLEVTDTM